MENIFLWFVAKTSQQFFQHLPSRLCSPSYAFPNSLVNEPLSNSGLLNIL